MVLCFSRLLHRGRLPTDGRARPVLALGRNRPVGGTSISTAAATAFWPASCCRQRCCCRLLLAGIQQVVDDACTVAPTL